MSKISDYVRDDDDDDVANHKTNSSEAEPCPRIFSDEALALRFAEMHDDDLRYVATWNKWLSWDGTRWLFDTTLSAWNEVRKICRAAAAECNKLKLASALASSKTVAAVISLARSDRRLAATVEQWNTDIWLANTPKGVTDLRTGKMRALSNRNARPSAEASQSRKLRVFLLLVEKGNNLRIVQPP